MRKELEQIFSILKNGTPEEIKIVKKKIDILWHKDRKNFEKNSTIALEQINSFESIRNPKNQEAFVAGLSIFFLVLADKHFRELKNFVLKVIRHPNGHIREQTRKTADWLHISLSARIDPFVYPEGKKLTQKQILEQDKAKEELKEYLNDLEMLMERYDEGSNDQTEYLDEMKPSIYKSLQLLCNDLTRGNIQRHLHTPPAEVLAKREEIEKELSILIDETGSDISFEEIQDVIYDETDFEDLSKVIKMFNVKSISELQNVTEIVNDAWNYFPHKILNGLCPVEILLQSKKEKLLN